MNIKDFLGKMNYNLESRQTTKQSNLAEIQKMLIELALKSSDMTNEKLNTFKANLFSNPASLEKGVSYPCIENTELYFNEMVKSRELMVNRTL